MLDLWMWAPRETHEAESDTYERFDNLDAGFRHGTTLLDCPTFRWLVGSVEDPDPPIEVATIREHYHISPFSISYAR